MGAGTRRTFSLVFAVSVLVFSMGAGALASTLNDVVPSSGSVAGHPYDYWLKRGWTFYFASSKPCHTAKAGGKTVTVVQNIGGKSSCHVPAGQPIFINALSTECSSIPGHHDGWGTSDSDLQKCSRTVTEKALITEWVDGRRVSDFGKTFWKGVHAWSVNIPSGRFPGVTQTRARAAAWGWSLLLKKLPRGTHTVKCVATKTGHGRYESRVTLSVK